MKQTKIDVLAVLNEFLLIVIVADAHFRVFFRDTSITEILTRTQTFGEKKIIENAMNRDNEFLSMYNCNSCLVMERIEDDDDE
jgi:hypothetical protein